MRIVLDTNIRWDLGALAQAGRTGAVLVLPVIAFIERARQVVAAGRDLGELLHPLDLVEVRVEDFTPAQGLQFATTLDQPTWDRHARDAFIAGHLGPDDVLWTKNPKDFVRVGVHEEQIVAM